MSLRRNYLKEKAVLVLPHEKKVVEYEETIKKFKAQNKDNPLFATEIRKLESKLELLKKKVYSELTPWERVTISRHPDRPHTIDYIKKMCDSFTELCGDRTMRDDRALVGGLARIGNQKFMLIGQEKGCDTESRVERNFGMLSPEGFRKALRLMKLAEKFQLPIVSLVDTPGAFPGLDAEKHGQGWIIANNLREMSQLTTPIIVVIIGEGFSGGALGTAVGDTIGMLRHSVYTVISPEGCASILWKDATKNQQAAAALRLNSEDLSRLEVIDSIIEEPLGGAHHDPDTAYTNVKKFILECWESLKSVPPHILVENRYQKFRRMGKVCEAGAQDAVALIRETLR